jgi:hypothetical protein
MFILVGFVLTAVIVFGCIQSGINKNDMMLRFRERQTVTMLSGSLLALTALTSLFIYFLRRKAGEIKVTALFWLFSSLGFWYLCMDEYFMIHEGIDDWVGSLFGKDIKALNLDNLVIAFYGLLAVGVCYFYRKTILSSKVMFPCLILGGVGLAGTVVFHSFEKVNIVYEVAEESFKLFGVVYFFEAYFLSMLSFLDRLNITVKPNT